MRVLLRNIIGFFEDVAAAVKLFKAKSLAQLLYGALLSIKSHQSYWQSLEKNQSFIHLETGMVTVKACLWIASVLYGLN